MIATDKPPLEEAYLSHISMKPWSEYSSSDYTPEQWHKACLIHQHQGIPTSKNQCKLPVRTPNGAINRNGVHAAAAALGGARGGVDASDAEKASARTALVRLYGELGEDAPAGLAKHSDMDDDEFLAHVGTKGMKWGVRKDRSSKASSKKPKRKMDWNDKVAIAASITIGAVAVARIVSRVRGNPARSAPRPSFMNNTSSLFTTRVGDSKWREAASMSRAPRARFIAGASGIRDRRAPLMSLDQIRRNMDDPNYVWEI